MADSRTVYLDHLIPRENLRYQRPIEQETYDVQKEPQTVRLSDLYGSHSSSWVGILRKPDFQRATCAWTPEDCASLLDSVVNDQTVPSVIMWASPENAYNYILDGGHRISVIMAWLTDDWGDKRAASAYFDEAEREQVTDAAHKARDLIKAKIGSFLDYEEASQALERALSEGKDIPRKVLGERVFQRAQFYNKLRKGSVGFHILWVPGDYKKAEASFLKINKSGKQLTEWETKLVENRDSRFARAVMSISNVKSAAYYWPVDAPDGPDKHLRENKIQEIVAGVKDIHETLFTPPFKAPVRTLHQPLLVASMDKKPFYVAELLTIIEGNKGNIPETERLIAQDLRDSDAHLIDKGYDLIHGAQEVLKHLVGPSPKSLALIPPLYFYSRDGRYVRSLLYGLIYWLTSGDDAAVLTKKRLFSVHRRAFEDILIAHKEELVMGLSRNVGSGPEVTLPTARFYRGLLKALIDHDDDMSSTGFTEAYAALASELASAGKRVRKDESDGATRDFNPRQKSQARLDDLLLLTTTCGICHARLDPGGDVQHDHIHEYAKGGKTVAENQRLTHPFCNNNRVFIEEIERKQRTIDLPELIEEDVEGRPRQLKLFSDDDFLSSDPAAD